MLGFHRHTDDDRAANRTGAGGARGASADAAGAKTAGNASGEAGNAQGAYGRRGSISGASAGPGDTSIEYLIVGLGNPGDEYAGTRHNAGFEVIERLGRQAGVSYWKNEAGCLTGEGVLDGHRVLLAKPLSYMNASGGPVRSLMKKRSLKPEQLIVVHDELDIPAATLRVKQGGGHGGHRGVMSIAQSLGTPDWLRVRCGIGRPPGSMDPSKYVLARPRGEAADDFAAVADGGAEAVVLLMNEGLEATRRQFHGKTLGGNHG